MENLDVSLILERMKNAVGARTDKALAEILNVKASVIANWKLRNSIQLENIYLFCLSQNISADVILFDKQTKNVDPVQQMALMAFDALDDKKKIEAIAFMSGLNTGNISGGIHQSAQGDVTNMVAGNQK